MHLNEFRYDYLTEKAKSIIDKRTGYRDDTLFPVSAMLTTDKRNPIHVASTEILKCGKYEICDFIIIHYSSLLSRQDYRLLTNIIAAIKSTGYPIMETATHEQLLRILNKLLSGCNYCLWLCADPKDIYEHYVKEYIPKADKIQPGYADSCPDFHIKESLTFEEYKNRYVDEIHIPEEFVILCDMGIEGSLIAFHNDNT